MPRKFSVGSLNPRSSGKTLPAAKKVLPPTVPESSSSSSSCSSNSSCSSSHRHSGSSLSSGVFSTTDSGRAPSFSSSLSSADEVGQPPRSPGRDSGCESVSSGSTIVGSTGSTMRLNSGSSTASSNNGNTSSPYHTGHQQQFTFPQGPQVPHFSHLLCPKVSPGSPHHAEYGGAQYQSTYGHHGTVDDQGIDVQSPGRSSPGSGSSSSTTGSTNGSNCCRNSTTSLDSGRASQSTQNTTHRHSSHSSENGSILRHSYHSSSSSLGSSEQEGPHINVQELIKNGVPDAEIVHAWLSELHLEEYAQKFIASGYDMPTISRMTPEDLNAIGITKPVHRKKIKQEISKLNIDDGLPDFIPPRLEEWLALLRLSEYTKALRHQKYTSVDQVTQITWEDLEDVGIKKLGHQKKMMLAIKRVKDIKQGKKKFIPGQKTEVEMQGPVYSNVADPRFVHSQNYAPERPYNEHMGTIGYMNPAQMHYRYPGVFAPPPFQRQTPSSIIYRPDIVPVQVSARAHGQREEPIYSPCFTFMPGQQSHGSRIPLTLGPLVHRPVQRILPLQTGGEHPMRSMDDGDITPTNEIAVGVYEGGGGTLPRPRNNKYRPVAKVTAKTRADVHQIPAFAREDVPAAKQEGEKIYSNKVVNNCHMNGSVSTNNTPQGTPKRMPPPLPKRSNSISESSKEGLTTVKESTNPAYRRGLSYGYMGVKNNLQPDLMSPNLPPPPPAPQDSGNHTFHSIDTLNALNTLNTQRLQAQDFGKFQDHHFPPPPPPLTCVTLSNSANNSTVSSNSSLSSIGSTGTVINNSASQTSGVYSNNEVSINSAENGDSDSDSNFKIRRNETNASFKSTSSTDSGESLPFANDNAGTIKQRVARSHSHGHYMHSPRSSPMSSPATLRRKDGVVHTSVRQPLGILSNGVTSAAAKNVGDGLIKNGVVEKEELCPPDSAADVLNDIGNMLANLTDELDAMLVEK